MLLKLIYPSYFATVDGHNSVQLLNTTFSTLITYDFLTFVGQEIVDISKVPAEIRVDLADLVFDFSYPARDLGLIHFVSLDCG